MRGYDLPDPPDMDPPDDEPEEEQDAEPQDHLEEPCSCPQCDDGSDR